MHKERKILKKVSQLDISCHVNILGLIYELLSNIHNVYMSFKLCISDIIASSLSQGICWKQKKNPFLEQQSKTTLSQFNIRTLQLSFIEQNREELSFPFPDDHIKSIL